MTDLPLEWYAASARLYMKKKKKRFGEAYFSFHGNEANISISCGDYIVSKLLNNHATPRVLTLTGIAFNDYKHEPQAIQAKSFNLSGNFILPWVYIPPGGYFMLGPL